MKRKGDTSFGVIALILLICAIAVIGLRSALQSESLSAGPSGAGGSVLSLSQVDFLSNDPQLSGKVWLLTMAQNDYGQYAVGSFTKDQIKDGDTQAQYDLTVRMDVLDETCSYPITYTGVPIKSMSSETQTCWMGITCNGKIGYKSEDFQHDCQLKPGFYAFGKKSASWDYICFWTTTTAYNGNVLTPTLTFSSKLSAASHGETVSGTISSASARSVWLGDKVLATWTGNLNTGEQCPISSDYGIAAAYVGGTWRITDKGRFDDYKTYDISGMMDCISRLVNYGTETGTSCTQAYNTYASNVLLAKTFTSPTGGTTATATGTQNNGQVKMILNKMIQYPVITFHIKAEWIGIVIPVGKPDILSISSKDFKTGDVGYIVANVKNVGTGDGSFSFYATCPSPFGQSGTSPTASLAVGETKAINIPVTAVCSEDTTKSCTVRAYDINQPNNYDDAAVSLTCKPILLCNAGETRCNGNVIEQCNAAGSGWCTQLSQECPKVAFCSAGCEMVSGVPTCSKVPPSPGDCYVTCDSAKPKWDLPGITIIGCKLACWWEQSKWYIFLLVVIVVLIAGIVLSQQKGLIVIGGKGK